MANTSKQKMSFASVPKDNEALASEIRDFVEKKASANSSLESDSDSIQGPSTRDLLEALLERLYVHICGFGRYLGNAATPDEKIIAAWKSFLLPINALTAVEPHGHMIAARMTLYLTEAYRKHGQLPKRLPMSTSSAKPIALRCNFAISLDDLLLSCLVQIWRQSNKREMFTWVFTSHPTQVCRCQFDSTCQDFVGPGNSVSDFHDQRRRDHIKTACITDPANLTPENGVQPRWRWTRPEGDTAYYPRDPDSSRVSYREVDGERMLIWQDIGSDGPIRESYHYMLVDEYAGETLFRDRAALRRSRQFILDTRKIAEYNRARDSERLAQVAMIRKRLPAELQMMVFDYLDETQAHPYISKLDLPAVYRPFPDINHKCRGCSGRASSSADKMAKATCPLNSLIIWSLPLRAFHTFHKTSGGDWHLCPHIDCDGHHRDSSWQSQVTVEGHLDNIVQSRCGQGLTINDIGLGPLKPARLLTVEEDRARERQLFWDGGDDDEGRDVRDEARWVGVAGLASVMLHSKTLLGLYNNGRTFTEPSWLLGRTRQEESRACAALARDHVRCELC